MTSIVMPSGLVGFDAAGFHNVTDFAPFPCTWLSLYLGGNFGVSRQTVEAAWRAGLPVMLNWERSANGGLGGATYGANAATSATQGAQALGMLPTDGPIVFSFVDFNPTAAQIPICLDCDHAMVDNMMRLGWTGGSYVPNGYGDHLAQQPWWPPNWPLWHWAGDNAIPHTWAWVQQHLGQKTYAGVTVDTNTLLKPMRFWNGDGPDDPPAVRSPQEEVMLLVNSEVYPQFAQAQAAGYAPPDGGWPVGWVWFELLGTGKKWVHDADFDARYQWCIANNVQGLKRTTGELQSIPDYVAPTGAVVDMGPLLAAVNGLQGSVTSVAAAVAEIPKSGTWGQ